MTLKQIDKEYGDLVFTLVYYGEVDENNLLQEIEIDDLIHFDEFLKRYHIDYYGLRSGQKYLMVYWRFLRDPSEGNVIGGYVNLNKIYRDEKIGILFSE